MIHRELIEGNQAVIGLIIADSVHANRLIHGIHIGSCGAIDSDCDSFGIGAEPAGRGTILGYGLNRGLNPLSVWLEPLCFLNIDNASFVPHKNPTRAIIKSSCRVVYNITQGFDTMIGAQCSEPVVVASEVRKVLGNEASRNKC